ncbi:branched-chain alpha-ketoacid dehydrogenase [Cladochytrium replicatum]|nr:branched-chain alpha-ketoacid dehydrogenase [Cladochytrium replicatum]
MSIIARVTRRTASCPPHRLRRPLSISVPASARQLTSPSTQSTPSPSITVAQTLATAQTFRGQSLAELKANHQFYDSSIDAWARQEIQPATLQYLIQLGENRSLIESARLLQEELPKRLARRVKSMQTLPFIVGVNPFIKSVYNLYYDSFETLRALPKVVDDKTQAEFSEVLNHLVASHQDVIPKLAKGFLECNKYMSKESLSVFVDDMIRARIGIRVLAEHHLSLQESHTNWIGVVNTKFVPADLVRSVTSYVEELCEVNYGSAPQVEITGDVDTVITYIPVHLEYILLELLKNAMRATVEHSARKRQRSGFDVGIGSEYKEEERDEPPIEVTICRGVEDISLRVRDQGGGISKKDLPFIFDYSYTTVPSATDGEESVFSAQARMSMQAGIGGPMAGLGFGLPMSRIYAKYFGGSLELVSIAGHGCDVFLQLPNISGIAKNVKI